MNVLTLGAASLLASQGEDLGFAAATMLMFGQGAAAPLLLVGAASRSTLVRLCGELGGLNA
jgi:cytochrome c-type biogenesis protein